MSTEKNHALFFFKGRVPGGQGKLIVPITYYNVTDIALYEKTPREPAEELFDDRKSAACRQRVDGDKRRCKERDERKEKEEL